MERTAKMRPSRKGLILCLLTITIVTVASMPLFLSSDYDVSSPEFAKEPPASHPMLLPEARTTQTEPPDTTSQPTHHSAAPPTLFNRDTAGYLSFTPRDEAALPVLVRPGEPPLTHADFLRCLADRLNVDVAARTQGSLVAEDTTPLIVFPMMMEVNDHRQLMCNMTNTIRYVMYVDNGGVPEVGRFLDDIVNTFGWTGRVVVRRYPWNAGFSGAVNNAIDWMLQLPEHEVPFIHVSNNDVRYPPGLYPRRIRDMHEATKIDVQRIRELEEEVAREDADPATWAHYRSGRALRGTWSPNATLVTSRLLPDRIRYMPHGVRKTQFQQHTALGFFNHNRDFSSFMLSRLGALTVGYWDENFYPAYFEDIDYMWRAELLGFQYTCTPMSSPPAVHLVNALRQMLSLAGEGRSAARYAPRVLALAAWMKRVFGVHPSYPYAMDKWATTYAEAELGVARRAEPFVSNSFLLMAQREAALKILRQVEREEEATTGGSQSYLTRVNANIARRLHRFLPDFLLQMFNPYTHIPLDAWVRDGDMVERIQMYGEGRTVRIVETPFATKPGKGGNYNMSLIQHLFVR